jgi:hypothetical protein
MTLRRPRPGAASILSFLAAGALAGTLVVAPPSSASTPPERSAAPHATVPRGPHHGAQTVTTTVPPGGDSTLTSSTIPKTATEQKIVISIDGEDYTPEELKTFQEWTVMLTNLPKPKDQLIVCLALHQQQLSTWNSSTRSVQIVEERAEAALVYLVGCLQAARILNEASRVSAAMARAGTRCAQGPKQFPSTLEKVSAGFRLTVDGAGARSRKRGGLKVTCRALGDKMVYTVKNRKKGKPLRKVIGKKLHFSILSPPDASGPVTAKVTFARPR